MRTIEQIMQETDKGKLYLYLTARKKPFRQDIEEVRREIDPKLHDVMDENIRKDKVVNINTKKRDPVTGETVTAVKRIPRVRVAIPFQKVIVERAVGFLFGQPVEYRIKGSSGSDEQKTAFDAIQRVMHDNKVEYFDKKLSRRLFIERECAELWYWLLDSNGRPTEMKVKLLSPFLGDKLYPHFDDYDRMDGFAREYLIYDEGGNSVVHFDVYTKEYVYQYLHEGTDLVLQGAPKRHGFSKIPVIYYRQEETEWSAVQPAINRVEELISNWGDTNDYYGSPSYFVKGKLKGFADKGEQGKVYQGEEGAEMRILSWDSSPNSMATEMATLISIIHSYTQSADISFDNMKTLGANTSGVALQLMFTDPHMKARVKTELFGEMFTRRVSVIKSGLNAGPDKAIADRVLNSLEVEPIFHPYMPKNITEEIQQINASTGGKQTMSQEEGVRRNPLINNPDEVIKQLQAEAQAAAQLEAVMDAFGGAE